MDSTNSIIGNAQNLTFQSTRALKVNAYSRDKLLFNKSKLESFSKLKNNWNGEGSVPIDGSVIAFVKEMLPDFDLQPEIFPTGRGGLQIEQYLSDDSFYEIEITVNEISAYIVNDEYEFEGTLQKEDLMKTVRRFYESSVVA